MRQYRNITDTELSELGVVRDWDESAAKALHPGINLIWVHNHRKRYASTQNESCLIRSVEIIKIDQHDITTDFGKYSLKTGRNIHNACGCMRFCDCYGRLYLPRDPNTA